MNDSVSAAAVGSGLLMFVLIVGLIFYIFLCFCYKRICEKCGVTPGVLIWIPILQLIPLLQVAEMPVWMIILFLIPLVNIVVFLMMLVKICQARGKSGWLAVLSLIPVANIFLLPYLAFSE